MSSEWLQTSEIRLVLFFYFFYLFRWHCWCYIIPCGPALSEKSVVCTLVVVHGGEKLHHVLLCVYSKKKGIKSNFWSLITNMKQEENKHFWFSFYLSLSLNLPALLLSVFVSRSLAVAGGSCIFVAFQKKWFFFFITLLLHSSLSIVSEMHITTYT